MEQRHERYNSLCEQIIHEFLVESYASRVDGIVAAAERNNSTPGDGEAVGFGAGLLEEGDVFAGAVIGIAGYGSGRSVGDFAWNFAESVPDGGTAAVSLGCTFDLVTVDVSCCLDPLGRELLTWLLRSPRGSPWEVVCLPC